jgi:DNA modification methylase
MIDIKQGDCLELIKQLPSKSIDLIVTDPPYLVENIKTGSHSELAKRVISYNSEIDNNCMVSGFDYIAVFDEYMRVMKAPNIYIWGSAKQIPIYLDYFVNKHKCKFDFIIWHKTNPVPLFCNKYMTDKEMCLYFRKGGKCQPVNYNSAKTVYHLPLNVKDKRKYNHPTIKPLDIIENMVLNSSNENDIILDTFLGSGTTGVACVKNNRKFIGFELSEEYCKTAKERIFQAEKEKINEEV